jgi:two-component system, NtrC family, sensor kinase
VKIDTKEVFEPIEMLRTRISLVACALFLLSILTVSLFARMISGPVRKLQAGTRALAAGDLNYRVAVKSSDEMGELADSFNDMAGSLKKITVSRDMLNIEMEERKAAERALKEAMKVKSHFIAMVSHELRTPLAAIKEGISIVLDGILGNINNEQKDFLNKTKLNVERLTRLINDILDFQKLESGKVVLDIRENDIAMVVKDIYNTMSPLAGLKGIGLTIKTAKGLPRIKFDRDRITQVLANLVSNAIKFTERGSVSIEAVVDDGFVHVTVIDSGKGIMQKDMPRLFKSFEQLEGATERKEGTGLGLAISKEIIENHGGRVWAESEYGKGTAIHFILPLSGNA